MQTVCVSTSDNPHFPSGSLIKNLSIEQLIVHFTGEIFHSSINKLKLSHKEFLLMGSWEIQSPTIDPSNKQELKTVSAFFFCLHDLISSCCEHEVCSFCVYGQTAEHTNETRSPGPHLEEVWLSLGSDFCRCKSHQDSLDTFLRKTNLPSKLKYQVFSTEFSKNHESEADHLIFCHVLPSTETSVYKRTLLPRLYTLAVESCCCCRALYHRHYL